MKNSLIKKIAVSGAVVVGMFAFGGGTPASASAVTPNVGGHFASRTVTYHINSSSKHWQKVWKKAIHKFDHNGTIKLKATSKKKAQITMTTVAKFKGKYATADWDFLRNKDDGTHVFKHVRLRLNRKVCGKQAFYPNDNMVVDGQTMETVNAAEAIAVGLGLNNSTTNKRSLVNETGWWNGKLTKADKLGLAKAYANVK